MKKNYLYCSVYPLLGICIPNSVFIYRTIIKNYWTYCKFGKLMKLSKIMPNSTNLNFNIRTAVKNKLILRGNLSLKRHLFRGN